MKKVLMLALALMVASAPAFAQGAKKGKAADKPAAAKAMTASGTVSAVAADSVTVKGKDGADMMFAVDATTNVVATGASHKAAAAKGDHQPTPITDFVKVGDMVSVKYTDESGTKHASSVRVTSSKPAMAKKK